MDIQQEIYSFLEKNLEEYDKESYDVKVEYKSNNQFELEYYTTLDEDWFNECDGLPLFRLLCDPPFTQNLLSLIIRSEDVGANGTQNWEFESLLTQENIFENLSHFELPLNSEETHNCIIVTYQDSYDENGGIGLLLDKCPALKTLILPSAPGSNFFERDVHILENLHIQTGFDHQNFIKNLSASTCFQSLQHITFRDYAQTYMENFQENCTSYEDYLLLIQSNTLPALKLITIQDCVLDMNQRENLTLQAKNNNIELKFEELEVN